MTSDQDDPASDAEIGALQVLLRDATVAEAKDFVRPDADTIDAYLLNNATDAQRKTVLAAMARSSAFRSEMFESAEELEALKSPEALASFTSARVSEPRPDLRQPVQVAPVVGHDSEPSILQTILGLLRQPAMAYAIAAAAIVVAVVARMPSSVKSEGPITLAWNAGSAPEVIGFDRFSRGGESPEEPPLSIPIDKSGRDVLLLVPVRRAEADVAGRYVVTLSEIGGKNIAEQSFPSDRMLDNDEVPIYLHPSKLDTTKVHAIRVTYSHPGHSADGSVRFETRIRLTGESR